MKRVGLYLGVSPSSGGMFQYAQSILDALIASGDLAEPVVAYLDEAWAPILAARDCRPVRLKAGRFAARMGDAMLAARLPAPLARPLARLFNPLVRQLAALRCDLWIFPAQDSLGYQIDAPTMVAVHDLMHRYEPHFPEVTANGRGRIRDHRFRNLIARACAVLVDSEVGRQQVVESYDADPGKIAPLPYIPPRYVLDAAEPADFRSRYTLPDKFLLYPAQFWAHKNHLALLEAVAAVRARGPGVELVCTGQHAHDYARIVARAEELGLTAAVHFPGYVPDSDMVGFYRRARAMIMPTYFGPTNIPPLEAFACGCPAAVSDIYGMPEQVGDAALLFDQRSVPSMAEAVARLWDDDALCASLRDKGLARSHAWRQPQFNARFRSILEAALARCSAPPAA